MTLTPLHFAAARPAQALALTFALAAAPLQAGNPFYVQRNLVSDGFIPAPHLDANLVNPWGIVFNPNGFVWVANNHTGTSTLYDGSGVPQTLVVTIPPAAGSSDPGSPTGIVFNSSPDFAVSQGGKTGPSAFIFAGEDGTLSGWAPSVDFTHAILAVDNSAQEAIYKGLALGANGGGHFLYATDFHNGKIDVFDKNFKPAHLPGSFADRTLPAGYGPFGIQNLNGDIYVTYAKQDADREDDVAGLGFGFVNVFDANGQFVRRLVSRGRLNAPWGLAIAPASFGRFGGRLLIGNFGDGRIHAYDLARGGSRGVLRQPNGRPIAIEGLWGLSFGNGLFNQSSNALFFAAGPDDENHGLYGRIDPAPGNGADLGDDGIDDGDDGPG